MEGDLGRIKNHRIHVTQNQVLEHTHALDRIVLPHQTEASGLGTQEHLNLFTSYLALHFHLHNKAAS